ncbi:hypothetical protein N2152v2_002472 [Parachlorella kessleri]
MGAQRDCNHERRQRADGRTIQAVEALNEPHRIHNHSFSAWESWEDAGGELKLGYKVRPVVAVPADAFARIELQHQRELMRLKKQLDKLGAAALPGWDALQGTTWELREAEALRRQLAECQSSLQHWQQEAARRQAALEEAQQEQQQQSFQPSMGLASQTAATIATLRVDLREERARHAAQLAEQQADHERQLDSLRREHSAMVNELLNNYRGQQAAAQQQHLAGQRGATWLRHSGSSPAGGSNSSRRSSKELERSGSNAAAATAAVASLEEQVALLQRRLQAAAAERDAEVGEVRAELRAALHAKDEEYHRMLMAKDSEIYWLLEERQRLDLALHTIKDMTALVRQTSPAGIPALGSTFNNTGLEQQQAGEQQQGSSDGAQARRQPPSGGESAASAAADGASGCESGQSRDSSGLIDPSLGFTVLGVPRPRRRGTGNTAADMEFPAGAAPAFSEGDGAVSGAESVAPGTQEVSEGAQEQLVRGGVSATAGRSLQEQRQVRGTGWAASEARAAPLLEPRAASQSPQEGEGDSSGSNGLGPALSCCQLRLSGPLPSGALPAAAASAAASPAPPPVQPWEVHGAVDLGAALAAADLAAGPLRQSMPAFMLPPPPRPPSGHQGAAGRRAGGALAPPAMPAASESLAARRQAEGTTAAGSAGQHGEEAAAPAAVRGLALGSTNKSGRSSSLRPSHPVFDAEARSRISTLYDMLNPFDSGSRADSPSAGHATQQQQQQEQQRRQNDLIRVGSHRGSSASRLQQWQQPEQRQDDSDDDSIHRVQVGGTCLVDYNGPRPDSITEDAMLRILDGPLPNNDLDPGRDASRQGERPPPRWRASSHSAGSSLGRGSGGGQRPASGDTSHPSHHQQDFQQRRGQADEEEEQRLLVQAAAAAAAAGTPGSHRHPPSSSAPASVAGVDSDSEAEVSPPPGQLGCVGAWASGSLSLPGSSRVTPLLTDSDRAREAAQTVDEAEPALGNLRKEHVAARRNRGVDASYLVLPTEAVKAMSVRSPGGADAMAQLLADRLTMRASMPEGGWLAGARKAHTPAYRRPDALPEEDEEEGCSPSKRPQTNSLRRSAPAGPTQRQDSGGSGEASRRHHPLRRSSFLTRAPVAGDMLFG